MERAELASLLWFVETCVTSNRLYFDGTLPSEEVEEAQNTIDRFLHQRSLSTIRIGPIAFKKDSDILRHATAAVVESSLIIQDLSLERSVDREVDAKDHEMFFRFVQEDASLGERARADRALDLVERRFRGSKCLAGLMSAGAPIMAEVRGLYRRYGNRASLVTGALINRFRLNYLNQLASHKRGAYVPNPNFEVITKQHVRLFKDFLLRKLAEEGAQGGTGPGLFGEVLREDRPLPPIGLYALMLTREKGKPIALLVTALEKFKNHRALRKLMWGHTRAGLKLQIPGKTLDDYHREVDDYFLDAYRRLDTGAPAFSKAAAPDRVKKYVVPALLSALAGLAPVPGVVAGAAALALKVIVGTAAGASARALGDTLLGVGLNSYISEYKSLQFAFGKDPAFARPSATIAEQVERVFERPLT
jgi:hypothetical protein